MQIAISELSKLSFINHQHMGDRFLSSTTYWDGSEWEMWIFAGTGLIKIQGTPVDADYWASAPQRDSDISIGFLSFIAKHANFNNSMHAVVSARESVHNMLSAIQTADAISDGSSIGISDSTRAVGIQFEYFIIKMRSLFDYLQEIIAILWDNVSLVDADAKKVNLPKSFARMITQSGRALSTDDIASIRGVPPQMAESYAGASDFFLSLRSMRDRFVHGGANPGPQIYPGSNGACIAQATIPAPFQMSQWPECAYLPDNPNGLLSLRVVMLHMLGQGFQVLNDFLFSVSSTIQFGTDASNGNHLFTRSQVLENMHRCLKDPFADLWGKSQ